MKNKTFKGTPGLWIEEDCAVYAENGSDIAAIYDGLPTDIHNMDRGIAQANARLIAAAPELLDALLELTHLHDCEAEGIECGLPTAEQWFAAENKAEAAINKALGNE